MSLRAGPSLLRTVVVLGSMCVAASVQAQERVSAGGDNAASRVLEIERVLGGASIRRDGRTLAMQPGFLLFNGELMTLLPGSRVDLRLMRYGDIDAMAASNVVGKLSFDKLPFSSWAVDLATHIRLDTGVLRVRWARSGDAEDWPLSVLVDRWKIDLVNGEYLFRRDDQGMVSCSVSGKVELVDESANVREPLAPGHCLTFTRDGTTERTELAIAEWPELGVVLMREQLGGSMSSERSLAMRPRAESSAPVVAAPVVAAPPPQAAAPKGTTPQATTPQATTPQATTPQATTPQATTPHSPLPVPPRVPLSVAEESVQAPPVKPEPRSELPSKPAPAPAPADTAVAPAPDQPAAASPPDGDSKSAPAPSAPAAASGAAATMQANAQSAAAEGSSGSGPEWIVNVMTVTDPDVAKQHIATLTGAGYPATLRKEVVRGRTSYRVIISGISNEQGARRTAQLLSSKMGYTTAWPLQKR
ncbi:MAG: hypothetical protein K0Q76_2417 [Panacagrimonas sp.]|jgi:hypothetical protein|nr:SPOR domain-containing protein [Panacagrimonas sp.]MCC2657309.1 hypothetical protein [Panacagrimonas sp.]